MVEKLRFPATLEFLPAGGLKCNLGNWPGNKPTLSKSSTNPGSTPEGDDMYPNEHPFNRHGKPFPAAQRPRNFVAQPPNHIFQSWHWEYQKMFGRHRPQKHQFFFKHGLTGGWATPLKNMSSSVGITIPNIWKNKCSKPPTNGVSVNNNPAPSGCAVALPEPAHVAPRVGSSLPGGCPRGWPWGGTNRKFHLKWRVFRELMEKIIDKFIQK